MFAALGKNDQKIHIVPSKGWVVVRQGESAGYVNAGGAEVPILFDNALWDYLNQLVCTPTATLETTDSPLRIWPNPSPDGWQIQAVSPIEQAALYDAQGCFIHTISGTGATSLQVESKGLSSGVFMLKIEAEGKVFWGKLVKQ